MDQSADFERAVEEMEWGDVVFTLQAVFDEILGDTPSPPPPPPPPMPAGLGFDPHPQPGESLNGEPGGCIPLGAAPHTFEQPLLATPGLNVGQAAPIVYQGPLYDQNVMQSHHLYSQAGAYSQGQYLPYQWPVDDVPREAATNDPVAPPLPYIDGAVVRRPEGMDQNLLPVGVLNREVVNRVAADVFAPSEPAATPPNTSMSKKHRNQEDDNRPYIKKPPNAFMLFMKEQRPNVVAELNLSDSAAVNAVLGQRWKSLSNEEQAKYYDEAYKERLLHSQRHPDWSFYDNYGKKRKRKRSKCPSSVRAEEVNEQDKKLCVTPVQTAVMEAPHPQTVLMGLPHAQTAENLPVCDICHLPQVYDIYWLGSPTTASTALVSPTSPTETQTSSPTTWSLMMEQPEPPAYPQLPSSPCTNIWTM